MPMRVLGISIIYLYKCTNIVIKCVCMLMLIEIINIVLTERGGEKHINENEYVNRKRNSVTRKPYGNYYKFLTN